MRGHALVELKATLKQTLGWLLLAFVLLFVFLSFYPTFESQAQDFKTVLENFPKEMLVAMGIDVEAFMSFGGFFSYVYGYILLILCIYSLNSGLVLMGKESRFNTNDFLYAKPISRTSILINKLVVGLWFVLAIHTIILIGLLIFLKVFNVTDIVVVFEFWVSGLLVSITFFVFGMILGQLFKIKKTLGLASGIVFGFFMLLMVARMTELSWLEKLTPFGWFESYNLLMDGLNLKTVFVVLTINVMGVVFLFINQKRRDLV